MIISNHSKINLKIQSVVLKDLPIYQAAFNSNGTEIIATGWKKTNDGRFKPMKIQYQRINSGIVNVYDETCLALPNPKPLKSIMNLITNVHDMKFNHDSQILGILTGTFTISYHVSKLAEQIKAISSTLAPVGVEYTILNHNLTFD
ncbi:hypothetical protein C2G38_2195833 [Gigaspora rosea]|uniref:Uncharacterized protein n=1 Tax=Gigaspora rosea TaxID=44941 RepID=A0A397UZJ3_9GLOM|nr:hypothetical protein C2G38_2195833 [Gigaspora rosea]